MNEVDARTFRKFITAFTVLSLYVITGATMYYNSIDNSANPVYHLLSQFFGGSVFTALLYIYAAMRLQLPLFCNVAATGIGIYIILNIGYSGAALTNPNFQAQYIQPIIENWTLGASSLVCTYHYIIQYVKFYDSRINRS